MSRHQITLSHPPTRITLIPAAAAAPLRRPEAGLSPPAPAPAPASPIPGGAEQQLREGLEELAHQVQALRDQQSQALQELQQVAVELAISAASWVTRVLVDQGEWSVDQLVAQGVARFSPQESIKIHIHPDDLQLLHRLQGATGEAPLEHPAGCDFVPDATRSRGSLRLDSARRSCTTDLDQRLADIRTTWLENLSHAQTERRHPDPHARPMRRFPDRRDTA